MRRGPNETGAQGDGGSMRRGLKDIFPSLGLLVACLTFQQHASVSQGRVCSDNFRCCHTEIEVVDPTFLPHPVTVY